MPRSARRRWTRELESEVDGVHLGPSGPVILHGYDPPAGGKWMDDVIPGKVGAFDRQSGERIWISPCEVGYGRGFGAGFGAEGELIVLGPSQGGHRICRMSVESGELLGAEPVPEFDWAIVRPDLCICVGPTQISGIDSHTMTRVWTYAPKGTRFHRAARDGNTLLVAVSSKGSRSQGLIALDARKGKKLSDIAESSQPSIEGLVADDNIACMLAGDLEAALPEEQRRDFQLQRLLADDSSDGSSSGGLLEALVGFDVSDPKQPVVRWHKSLEASRDGEELGEPSLAMDSGKLYVARGAVLTVLDALSGRDLGEAVVPALDEYVAWHVSDGAFLLAEENRASVYEIPD